MLVKHIVKDTAKKLVTMPVSAAKNGAKAALTKLNPLDKPINKEDVSDHGVEGVRLGYGTAKKGYRGIKTASRTIKTTQRTIRTTGKIVREGGDIAYKTGKGIYKTARVAAKTTVIVVKATVNVAAHIIAVVMSPVFWIIAAAFLIFLLIACVLIVIFGSETSRTTALTNAAGLGDVPAQYQEALDYFNIAVQNQQNGYNALFDGMYFDFDDLRHSNLVYMERTKADDTETTYQKSFASDDYRDTLKDAWEFGVTAPEAIAIAYVFLEKVQNEANGTEHEIYEVAYSQSTFDTIVAKCVAYNDTLYTGQRCSNSVCSPHVMVTPNPAYDVALNAVNLAANAYNDWVPVRDVLYAYSQIRDGTGQINYWNKVVTPMINGWIVTYNRYPDETNAGNDFLEVLGREYETAVAILDNTPPTIETIVYDCDLLHDLHSIGLYFYDKEDVMNALNFTDADKQWVELTESGFENNPDIP